MTKPSYNQLIGTLRIAGGLIRDALPTAQGTAAEALAHAYEAIETTLHGAVEPKPPHEREPPHCASCSCGMTAVEPTACQHKFVNDQNDDTRRNSICKKCGGHLCGWCGVIESAADYAQNPIGIAERSTIMPGENHSR